MRAGGGACVGLPERPERPQDAEMRPLDPPAEPAPLAVETLRSGSGGGRTVTRNLATGRTELVFDWDCGGLIRLPNGLLYEDTSVARYSIVEGDPLSARVEVENTADYGRGDWRVHIEATGVMTSTATDFLVSSRLDVYEGDTRIAARAWDHRFPRDHG